MTYKIQSSSNLVPFNQTPKYHISLSQLINILSTRCKSDKPMVIAQHFSYDFREDEINLLVFISNDGLYNVSYNKDDDDLDIELVYEESIISKENIDAKYGILGLWEGGVYWV